MLTSRSKKTSAGLSQLLISVQDDKIDNDVVSFGQKSPSPAMCHPSRTKKFHKQAAKNTFYARLSVAKNAAIFLSFEVLL
jgi:hypothetical protein